jgi:[ribosomal protein S5]-alanine N-acetyltransferase
MISLREYKQDDTSALVALANNENVSRYMSTVFPYPYTVEDAEWWISEGCKSGIVRAIEYENQFVGSVGAHPYSGEKMRTAAIGYWVGQCFWGKGIASTALGMLTQYMFSETSIVRLEASIYSPNQASMKVAEKAGYKCEAILKNAIYKHGRFYNEHLYSRIKS